MSERRPGVRKGPIPTPDLDRMLGKIDASGDCWLWLGIRHANGYGLFQPTGLRNRMAHRYLYVLLVGPVEEGLQLDHLCRNRACVNPDHLEPVTPRENVLRSPLGSGARARRTHCPAGHEYTPENTRLSRRRQRTCRTCNRESERVRAPRRWQKVLAARAAA